MVMVENSRTKMQISRRQTSSKEMNVVGGDKGYLPRLLIPSQAS
ncbi:MAG: hypothetical protein RLZZ519_1012 [Bacteroidota bacterium]|jgi:hypothetical protein